jgi:hypothetical protein
MKDVFANIAMKIMNPNTQKNASESNQPRQKLGCAQAKRPAESHKEWLEWGLEGVTRMHRDEEYRKEVSKGLV